MNDFRVNIEENVPYPSDDLLIQEYTNNLEQYNKEIEEARRSISQRFGVSMEDINK